MTDATGTTTCRTLGLAPSFGFGDRIGLATPGHVAALKRSGAGIEPIFPQQSIREMARTGRTPSRVMDDALAGMAAAGWTGRTGADADHLKTTEDVDVTAAVGFSFFTIDPSAFVDAHADDYDEATVRKRFAVIAREVDWIQRYLKSGTPCPVPLTEQDCLRAAVKYGRAINHAVELAKHIASVHQTLGRDYEIELSVDETEQPTTLAEHYIIADQCVSRGMKLVSLAPRFIGDFEKGVDFKGNLDALAASLDKHAELARTIGPYKLSLHSGSDKLSMYPLLARATKGLFHVKTAGTSYLEALRVVALCEPKLFRRIVDFARAHYDKDKATYHVSATLESVPPADQVSSDKQLERLYLECWEDVPIEKGFTAPGRQILHCTFGSVLTSPEFGPAVRSVLEAHPGTYQEVLADHFGRHLDALRAGL
jgi:tagaturonate epimerase